MDKADNEGLSWDYRLWYSIKYVGLHVFGPAQLTSEVDPQSRLKRRRAAMVSAARSGRIKREAHHCP